MQTFLKEFGLTLRTVDAEANSRREVVAEHPNHALYLRGDIAFEVPLEKCTSLLHFPYHLSGWHPFVQTLLQYKTDADLSYETSILSDFYQAYQPKTVLEAFVGHLEPHLFQDSGLGELGTDTFHPFFPWEAEERRAKGGRGFAASHGHQAFGPVSLAKGRMEFRRLTKTYDSIKRVGYVPEQGFDGDIRGFFLKTEDDYRFVIRRGHHRTPALSVLGFRTIQARFFTPLPRAIFLSDSANWPQVRRGRVSQDLAERIFMMYFEEEGTEKARALKLQ